MSTNSWGPGVVLRRGSQSLVLALVMLASLLASGALAAPVNSAPASATVSLALPLTADVSGLERFATAVSTPGSPQYGQYESITTLSRRFGATPATRARVLSYLRAAGASDVKVDVTGLFADATFRVRSADRLFGASLADFHSARAGRYMAPAARPRIPAGLRTAVTGVVGLNTESLFGKPASEAAAGTSWPHAAAVPAPATESADQQGPSSGYTPRTGTASGCTGATSQQGFTPNQYLTAYNYAPLQAEGLSGQGERVALIEIDGFKYSDLKAFAACFGLATPQINGYGVGLRRPLAAGGESTLDLEVLDSAAPKLSAVDVYESRPDAVDVLHALTAPLADTQRKPDVISASLGACEPATVETIGDSGLRSVEGALAEAAASGISVLASSGDDGSSACLDPEGNPLPGLAVSFPASSPWVTGVGGTNFMLDTNNNITSQNVWNDAPLVVAAGGGGLSDLFRRPAFQNGFVVANRRAVPDVSMLADVAPGYEIYCTATSDCVSHQHPSPWSEVGGTSAAAPLVAGGLALVDQDLRQLGHQDIGLANPLLYKIDHSPQASSVIADVTSGSNDLGESIQQKPFGCCSAEPGFDYASGLGSINLGGLAGEAPQIVPKIVTVGLSLPSQREPVLQEHLLARVSCSGRCLMGAYARIAIGATKHPITAESHVYLLRRAGRRTIRIPLSKKTLRALVTGLGDRKRITATIYGAILDPSGIIEAQTRGKSLRIKG